MDLTRAKIGAQKSACILRAVFASLLSYNSFLA